MTDGQQRSLRHRSVRGLAVLAAAATIAAGVLAAGSQAAMASTPGHIDGGVEDGTFSPTCLSGSATPDPGVLDATTYRDAIGDVVRILVPWNIAEVGGTEFSCFVTWLTDAHNAGAVVELSINRANANSSGPDSTNYSTAMAELDKYLYTDNEAPYLTYLSAWNEPNNSAYLNLTDWATRAGEYFHDAKTAFAGHGITMVAGDFSSTAVSAANLDTYISAAGGVNSAGIPTGGIWSTHPYSDVREFEKLVTGGDSVTTAGDYAAENSTVTSLAANLHTHQYGNGTRIWIGEVAIYDCYPAKSNCLSSPTYSTAAIDDATGFLSGSSGADTLAGYIKTQTSWPQVGRYIYLRADDSTANPPPYDSGGLHVLQVNYPDAVYDGLTGS